MKGNKLDVCHPINKNVDKLHWNKRMPAKINLLTSFYKYWGEIFMAVNIEYFLSQKYDRYELQ